MRPEAARVVHLAQMRGFMRGEIIEHKGGARITRQENDSTRIGGAEPQRERSSSPGCASGFRRAYGVMRHPINQLARACSLKKQQEARFKQRKIRRGAMSRPRTSSTRGLPRPCTNTSS